MERLVEALRNPIELPANRPARFYRGGRLLGAFRGDPAADDDDRPEDWVGSATRAWRPADAPPTADGLSVVQVDGRRLTLEALMAAQPGEVLGGEHLAVAGPTLGLLVKLLDAGERLPVHAHPDRPAAARHLASRFGKTEAWIVIGTRYDEGPARVWAGFRDPVPRERLRGWIETQDAEAMLAALVELEVAPGDVVLVPAGTPHAIGPGVFLVELQEPTDFSVVAETRGFPIEPDAATLGLGWDTAIGLFTTSAAGELRQRPTEEAGGVTRLLGPAADPFFRAFRVEVDGTRPWPLAGSFAVGVVVGGAGEVRGVSSALSLRRGTTFALPALATHDASLTGSALALVACLPPNPAALWAGSRGTSA
jgi:mannose-6-phosphate isomerase